MNEKYYISTAIAYTSSKPHVGNTYEIVLADAIARYKRLLGYDVYFQTGTDEHGEKIELKAMEASITPQDHVDKIANEVKEIFDIMNTSYDQFIRTTDKNHKLQVQKIFKKLYEQGDIYKGQYEGLYCTPCESFFTEAQLVDGKCPDCGAEVHKTSEETYFLKLSKYSEWLEKYINENPDFIKPESRKNEIINNFIKPGLQDLCVSRTSFKWGIPVDFDENHVVYVWIDALSNYITFLGYQVNDANSEKFDKYWPADLHLIGKDILRFHTIYWPVMLKALGLDMPKQIFGHPWVLSGNDKMSKSKGNVIYADDLVNLFGVDAVRYYMLHEIPYSSDGIITHELLIERINSDLANVLGNLVNRTISMINKYFDGKLMPISKIEKIDQELIDKTLNIKANISELMNSYRVADALEEIINNLRRCNKYIDETTPWILAKEEDKTRLNNVLYILYESIRHNAVLLQAFLPDTSTEIFNQLNTNLIDYNSIEKFIVSSDIEVSTPRPLFIRIDKEKKLLEISNN